MTGADPVPERARGGMAPAGHSRSWHVAGLLAAVGLAILAQRLVDGRVALGAGLGLYAAAICLFLLAAQSRASRAESTEDRLPPSPLVADGTNRVWLIGCAEGLAFVAFLALGGNRFSRLGLIAWLGALAGVLIACAERPGVAGLSEGARGRPSIPWAGGLALAAVLLLAAFFQFHRLAEVPAEMTSDHVEKLLDVHDVLQGRRSIYFLRNTGREPLQFYLSAALVQWTPLPLGHLALKVGTAALGWLAVPLTFLLGRQLYGARAGLIAAALLAISTWHIAISRVGLRFPLTAVFAVPSLFFLFRALRANRRRDWLACGALLGAGLYGYTPFRIVPPLIAVLVGLHALIDLGAWLRARASGRRGSPPPTGLTGRFWLNVLCGAAVCALVALPLLRYLYDEPATFWYRSLSRVGEGGGLQGTDIWPVLARNVANALLMFNYQGDAGWVNTVRWAPVLDGVTGALFVLGLAAVGWRILVGRDRFSLYLILSLFALLVPSILSLAFPGENPSVVRAGGAAPLAMLVAALPLAVTIERLVEEGGRGRRWLAAGGVAALIALGAWHAYAWYFVRYDAQYRASSWNSREMAAAVRAFVESGGDLRHAYHVPYPHWVDTRAIGIDAGAVTWNNAVADTAALGAHAVDGAPKLYLLHPRHPEVLAELQRLYPSGRATLYRSPTEGKDFVLFLVPGTR